MAPRSTVPRSTGAATIAARITLLAIVLASQTACAVLVHPADVHVAWAATQWPDVTLAELQDGRTAYVNHCAGCHTLVRPETHAPDEWPDLVREMQEEQGVVLTPDERRQIVRFLEAASEIPVVPKAAR